MTSLKMPFLLYLR